MKSIRKAFSAWMLGLLAVVLSVTSLGALQGCTNLDEETFGSVTADNFYKTEDEVIAALAPVYAVLRSSTGARNDWSQVTTDETIVPTRGSDWYDGGKWLAVHQHTWDPQTDGLNGAWNDAFTGVARANAVLQVLESSDVPNKEVIIGEVRALRAFFYYQLMDMFGGVPVIGDEPGEFQIDPKNLPSRLSRKQTFEFVEAELKAAREVLPPRQEGAAYGRFTKGACDAILAAMYLNAEVYTGEVTNNGLTKGQARWQDAITYANNVINSGVYRLETNWFDNFDADNHASPEHILAAGFLNDTDLGLTYIQQSLHYSQFNPSPWNGFSTLAEVYNSFDDEDLRKEIFLVGPQVNVETGLPVNDRSGNRLVFTPEFTNILNAGEGEGVRVYKFPADPQHKSEHNGNDFPIFRLAEMYMIRAEAENELGQLGAAIQDINVVRARVFGEGSPKLLNAADYNKETLRTRILLERRFEFTYESKRRSDMVRMGVFTNAGTYHPASQPWRILFPIPQTQMDSNPNLVQNPGY